MWSSSKSRRAPKAIDVTAGPVGDRPEHPAAEAVDEAAAAALARQAGGDELFALETLAREVLGQRIPAARCETNIELGGIGGREPFVGEEFAGLLSVRVADESIREEGSRRSMGLDETLPLAGAGLAGAAALVAQRDANPGRELLHRLGEREVLDVLQEPEDVTVLAAAEAVIHAARGG